MVDLEELSIVKIDRRQLTNLEIANGFTRWFKSNDAKSKNELKMTLQTRLLGGSAIWAAVHENKIIGFAIITEWTTVPGIEILDAIEVAEQYRNIGIGESIINSFFKENPDAMLGLLLYAEPGQMDNLKRFYKKLGFKIISEGVMIRIPPSSEKAEMWKHHLKQLRDFYNNLLKAFA